MLILVFSLSAQAQDIWKYRTVNLAFNYGSKWDEPQECNILVVMNGHNDKVQIFSKELQTFDITKTSDVKKDKDGDNYVTMEAVDQDGKICTLKFINLKQTSSNGRVQLYIFYSNMGYVYNMYSND
jgi:hypothetical protein